MYKSEVIAEIVKQHTKIFGRGPKWWENIAFRWAIRNWSYEQLLNGLLIVNVEVFNGNTLQRIRNQLGTI